MPLVDKFAALVAHPLVRATCQVLNLESAHSAASAVSGFLQERFTDHSQKLAEALQRATERSWKTLELSLAGKSFTQRLSRSEDAAFRSQVDAFLASLPRDFTEDRADFRQRCLVEARGARSEGLLRERPDRASFVEEISAFVRFASPAEALEAEWRALGAIGDLLSESSYPNLGKLLKVRPTNGHSILVVAVRYFFRREVVKDEELHREHVFVQLSQIKESQDAHFSRLEGLLASQGDRFEETLGVLATQMSALINEVATLRSTVDRLSQKHHLGGRPLNSRDSFSYRDDTEREQIRELRNAFRRLPPDKQLQLPTLLRDLGKLTAIGGDFKTAEQDFKDLAAVAPCDTDKAEAWFNAYQVALQQQDWGGALEHFQAACQLQPSRYAPFPLERYIPERILGAGGFGVAFLCHDRNLQRKVVVKALQADALAGTDESLLAEARALMQVKHPGIVELFDCDHADRTNRSRPFLVMEHFENSVTLEEQVRQPGALLVEEVLGIIRAAAIALQAAHDKRIYHRDVKPGNLLVRKGASGWETKLIDFGLALKQELIEGARALSGRSILGASVAGTAEFAAPEQLGRLKDVSVGPYSDIYGLGKTCCYALFQTTRPLRKHWANIPPHLVDLLERSTDDNPNERPQTIQDFLRDIAAPHASHSTLGPIMTALRNRLSGPFHN